jgi:hypothetical protein
VLGAVMDREEAAGIGVIGVSVKNLGNPLETFSSVPTPADGSGVGVLGTSGTGTGVRGASGEGSGGKFSSEGGPGVVAESDSGTGLEARSGFDRAAVFQSGTNVAQINLVPHEQKTREPELPKEGRIGDLLLIRNIVSLGHGIFHDRCSLWLCVPGSGVLSANAFWQEIQLGSPVMGTV